MARYTLFVASLCASACVQDPRVEAPGLEVRIAALTLPGIADVCYDLAVYNVEAAAVSPAALVWSRDQLCAGRYGDAEGAISYVGTCDAAPAGRTHTVALTLTGICSQDGCDVTDDLDPRTLASTRYRNPCPASAPCRLERQCSENADTLVEFNLTILREAEQGFFDVAVSFDDIFCSAKLDCVPELLSRPGPDGARDLTAVLAFACTSGENDTCLYGNDVTLDCGAAGSWVIDPSGGPGNLSESVPLLYRAAVYRGEEAFDEFRKSYWNVALGLDEAEFGRYPDCSLRWSATASAGPLVGSGPHSTPPGAYPVIEWERAVLVEGALACTEHPVNVTMAGEDEPSVATRYTEVESPATFAHAHCDQSGPEPVTGSCGAAQGQSDEAAPTEGLCASGLATAIAGDGPYTWSCVGSSGGATASCAANRSCAGTMLSWGSCSGWQPAEPHGYGGELLNTAAGHGGRATATCSQGVWSTGDTTCGEVVDGLCGASDGLDLASAPSAELCAAGTPTAVLGFGPWTWSCLGQSSGTNTSCTAYRTCGATTLTWGGCGATTTPTTRGQSESLANTSPGFVGSATATCSALGNGGWILGNAVCDPIVIGACGDAAGGSTLIAPSADLCDSGVPSAVGGTGPFTWTCAGAAGGATASCSSDRSCEAQTVTWGSCSQAKSGGSHGSSDTLINAASGFTGSATATCSQGTWLTSDTSCESSTRIFEYSGAVATFVVPDGVTSVMVEAFGAEGGTVLTAVGGRGAAVTATLPVVPGEVLEIRVGGQGSGGATTAGVGGYNGGGGTTRGAVGTNHAGAGGGGATDIRRAPYGLNDRQLVAGGGGGAGGHNLSQFPAERSGGHAGQVGNDGPSRTCASSRPGGATQSAAGQGATASCSWALSGSSGVANVGGVGNGTSSSQGLVGGGTQGTSGGGGGGGRFGGGGAAGNGVGNGGSAGGGGGSSYVVPTATNVSYLTGARTGHGRLTLTY